MLKLIGSAEGRDENFVVIKVEERYDVICDGCAARLDTVALKEVRGVRQDVTRGWNVNEPTHFCATCRE